MEMIVEIPDFNPKIGVKYNWEDGFEIKTQIKHGEIIISANKAGLRALANHLLNLSQNAIPIGHHLHFDENNSLENGSVGLIIEKI